MNTHPHRSWAAAAIFTLLAGAAPCPAQDAPLSAAQIAQLRQSLTGLGPIERRDALRQYLTANLPAAAFQTENESVSLKTVASPTLTAALTATVPASDALRVLSPQLPAAILPADATPAQASCLDAQNALASAFLAAQASAFGDNSPSPEQRRDFALRWHQTDGAALWAQAQQSQQMAASDDRQQQLQFRKAQAASSRAVASRSAGGSPVAAALAQRDAACAGGQQILARADLTSPEQRRDALRAWYERNRTQIAAAQSALDAALPADPFTVPAPVLAP